MDVLLIGLVLVVVVAIDRRRARAGRAHVEAWARARGLTVDSCRYRYLRLYRRPQFRVEMVDRTGRRAKGVVTVAGRDGRRTRATLDGDLAMAA